MRGAIPAHVQVKRFSRTLVRHFLDEDVTNVAAMLAYYAVMSLFPMLVFVLSLALIVLPEDTVRQGIAMATSTVPSEVAGIVQDRVTALMHVSGAKLVVVGAALALWGASRGAIALMQALGVVFQKQETRSWIRRQLTAFAVTIGVGVLSVIALSLLVIGPVIGHWIADRAGLARGDFDLGWNIARWVGAGVLVMLLWAVVYRFLPNTDAPFRVFTPGAITGVLLWLGLSWLFALYLNHFNSYETTYGALGGAIIFLTWLWLSNMTLLIGAQINDVIADLRAPKSAAEARLADPNELATQGSRVASQGHGSRDRDDTDRSGALHAT
jgi:membrane protein